MIAEKGSIYAFFASHKIIIEAPFDHVVGFPIDKLTDDIKFRFGNMAGAQRRDLIASVYSWPLRVAGKVILIDTCGGNEKDRPERHMLNMQKNLYLDRLKNLGAPPEDVDMGRSRSPLLRGILAKIP